MPKTTRTAGLLGYAALLLCASTSLSAAQVLEPTTPPDPPKFDAQGTPNFVGVKDMFEYRALPEYHEPAWVTEKFVSTGKLPPVAERLPKEPLVYKASNMPDGIGVYGDVMRHVIGGRPEGWNYMAGQSQGWGGTDIGTMECLTRTGPLFQVKAEELEPLPNLAKSWEWSADGHTLTMHLIEGAKWSDGVPFTSEDVLFYWEDNVVDPNVTPLNGASPESFGEGTTLKAIDDYTIEWTFKDAFPKQYLYQMAYGDFCPGPAHIFKPLHPKYKAGATYDEYKNAIKPEYLNIPVMGAWVPAEYRADDIIVMLRNPYYWKVDEAGNQLPYLDEVHYRLSTWADRDVQAVAGTADNSAMEQPENYVESLKRAADPNAPSRLQFGARTIGYTLYPNLSANGWGEPDSRRQAVRELNRNFDFRKGITTALDRQSIGEALVKGPFTAIYPGGLYAGTTFYDKASTVYYPYSAETARAYFTKAGLSDTDGDGILNFPSDQEGGRNLEITILANADYQTDKNLAEAVIAQMERVGIRVVANFMTGTQFNAAQSSGQFDWVVIRNGSELVAVVQNTASLAPTGPRIAAQHQAGPDGTMDLLPFESEMVEVVNAFTATDDSAERIALMQRYQKLYTENVYAIGLTQYPGAEIINKRFANVPAGVPIFMFNWDVDNMMRERLFVPADKQPGYELHPQSLPGAPGIGNGPIS